MRKPNWRNIGILLLVVALLTYLVIAIVKFSHKSNDKVCKQVVIKIKDSVDIQFVSTKDIELSLERNKFELDSVKLKHIQTQEIEKVLEKNPFIKNAECFTSPSGDLNIEIWQREPIFRVVGVLNYYVDVEGKTFPISQNYVAYVPVVTGAVNKEFAVSDLKDFVLYLRRNEFWNAQIEQIDVIPNKEIVLIPRVGSHEIELGSLDNYKLKLAKLKKFYLKGLNKIGWGKYKKISLKYKNQVVCTKK